MVLSNKNIIGLSVDILDDESYLINYVSLKVNGKNISVVEKKQNITNIQSLINLFDSNSYVNLTINGKGIINKKYDLNSIQIESTQDKLVNFILPNANSVDFYAQKNLSRDHFFVTIARKSVVDNILAELETVSCYPIKLILGPYDIKHILSIIKNKYLVTYTYLLDIEDNEICDIQRNTSLENIDYIIEGEEINSTQLLAFSSALSGTLNDNVFADEIEMISLNRININFRLIFKKRMLLALLILFAILLSNFLVYDFLFEKLEISKKNTNDVVQNQKEIARVKRDFENKKQFILQKNWNTKYAISEIIELLASSSPEGLKLTEINYQPESIKRTNTEIVNNFQYKKIIILGVVNNSTQLNNWMKYLVESNYFADVSLVNYQLSNSGIGNIFNLEITLK